MTITEPKVILVDSNDQEIGSMNKLEAHEKGALHRAFSIFLFDENDFLLLQQRALHKYHSPGLWTNTCCSHQSPGQSNTQAAEIRLQEELGINAHVYDVFSFEYRTYFDNGLIEHEYDHVLVGRFTGVPNPNPEEVSNYQWITMPQLLAEIETTPEKYTYWLKEIKDKLLELPQILREYEAGDLH